MDHDQKPIERAFERIARVEQAVSRMEAELASFAENTAKQFEDFVRQVGTANNEWNNRLRELQGTIRSDIQRIENAGKIPWLGLLGIALTICAMAAGLVRYSLEARTRTLEVTQTHLAEKIELVKTAQQREIELTRQLLEQRLADLRVHVDKLETKK